MDCDLDRAEPELLLPDPRVQQDQVRPLLPSCHHRDKTKLFDISHISPTLSSTPASLQLKIDVWYQRSLTDNHQWSELHSQIKISYRHLHLSFFTETIRFRKACKTWFWKIIFLIQCNVGTEVWMMMESWCCCSEIFCKGVMTSHFDSFKVIKWHPKWSKITPKPTASWSGKNDKLVFPFVDCPLTTELTCFQLKMV